MVHIKIHKYFLQIKFKSNDQNSNKSKMGELTIINDIPTTKPQTRPFLPVSGSVKSACLKTPFQQDETRKLFRDTDWELLPINSRQKTAMDNSRYEMYVDMLF